MQKLGTLKTGESYGNGKYRVLSNYDGVIKIRRIEDNHLIVFHSGLINWKHLVKKDN